MSCVDRFLELDPETFKYIDHSEDKPLFRSDFSGITQDAQGNFWLISSNGLFKYNPSKDEVKRFGKPDGVQGNRRPQHNAGETLSYGNVGKIQRNGCAVDQHAE